MTGVWIGAAILLPVVLPIVVVLLKGVLDAATSIVPSVDSIAATAAKRVEPTSTPPRRC